jgi:hypothetical protein
LEAHQPRQPALRRPSRRCSCWSIRNHTGRRSVRDHDLVPEPGATRVTRSDLEMSPALACAAVPHEEGTLHAMSPRLPEPRSAGSCYGWGPPEGRLLRGHVIRSCFSLQCPNGPRPTPCTRPSGWTTAARLPRPRVRNAPDRRRYSRPPDRGSLGRCRRGCWGAQTRSAQRQNASSRPLRPNGPLSTLE